MCGLVEMLGNVGRKAPGGGQPTPAGDEGQFVGVLLIPPLWKACGETVESPLVRYFACAVLLGAAAQRRDR
jgi:hypothetical protein